VQVIRDRDAEHFPLAFRTTGDIDSGEFVKELLPGEALIPGGMQSRYGSKRVVLGRVDEKKTFGGFPFCVDISRSEQTKVANADKALREDVQQKAANELECRQADKPVCARLVIIAGTEGNGLRVESKDALVGDGGSVGVPPQVAIDVGGSLEGRFCVGVPFDSSQVADEFLECVRVLKVAGGFWKKKVAFTERFVQGIEEFSPKDFSQGPDGDQEVVFCRDPS